MIYPLKVKQKENLLYLFIRQHNLPALISSGSFLCHAIFLEIYETYFVTFHAHSEQKGCAISVL